MQNSWKRYSNLLAATRAKDWRFSFIPQIFGNLYLWFLLFDISFKMDAIALLVLSLITSFGFAALGYFINEFFDKEDDAKAGKLNKLQFLSGLKHLVLLVLILAFAFLPWLILPYNNTSIMLIIIQVVLFLLYAAPPFRFKKNAYLSGFTDALYAYTVPLLLSHYTYYLFAGSTQLNLPFLIAYSTLLFTAGYRNIIIHYINDIFKDKKAGLITLPRVLGVYQTNVLLKGLLIAEFILGIVVTAIIVRQQAKLFLLLLPVFYLAYKAFTQFKQLPDSMLVNKPIRHIPDLFYQFYAPAIILLVLISEDFKWLIIVPFHLVLFVPFFRFHPIISWFQRINFGLYYIWMRQLLSWIVNYTIFFLFLLIGVNLKKRQTSALGYIRKKLHIE